MVTEMSDDFILPFRFDDSQLDGLRDTIAYIDISNMSPKQCADMILRKIQGKGTAT